MKQNQGKYRYRSLACSLAASVFFTASAQAEFWGASAVTATPDITKDGLVTSYTLNETPYGRSIASNAKADCGAFEVNCLSIAHRYLTVNVAENTKFYHLWIRAYDDVSDGFVTATFYKQRLLAAKPDILGSVSTKNSGISGFQLISMPLTNYALNGKPEVIDTNATYYIGLSLHMPKFNFQNQNISYPALMIFDAGMDDFECHPNHPDYDIGCKF